MKLVNRLHAFDLEKLDGKEIIVRTAGNEKTFTTLDSKERKLEKDDLMICDAKKPVAFAGVMGGENSEVTESTKNILIESAYFNPSRIRKTAKRLALSTDASYRFERGTDIEITMWAAQRAAQLIAELSGGEVCQGELDVYPQKFTPIKVDLRFARLNKIMGYDIPAEKATAIIKNLGINVTDVTDEKLTAEIPAFRPDIEREIDLVEEVARISGYDNIPMSDHLGVVLEKKIDQSKFVDDLRNKLIGLGFNEIVTNTLLNENKSSAFGKPIELMNPQSKEMSHLRTSLVPGALITVSNNLNVREPNLSLFEIGHTFKKTSEKDISSFDDILEKEELLILLSGKFQDDEWHSKAVEFSIYHLKGVAEELLNKLNLNADFKIYTDKEVDNFVNPIVYKSGDKTLARIGKLNRGILKPFDIDQDVYVAELDVTELSSLEKIEKSFEPLLKYPKVIRDCSFVLDKNITTSEVEAVIYEGSSNLLKNIKLFDIFESDSLGEGKKSLAFQLEFYDASRTLTEEEVEKDFWRAIESVKNKLNAELRGG
ncbi:MAG: phenylalanine--tRNA ligase subunit beta [Melioribacteraceae bacterium]|nr:phenylalanine--tRNA ligase subunit beta [Melioribacteraceae bacterium]